MTELTIIANIHAKADQIEMVRGALLRLVPPTQAETGCINYDLHQDDEDPAHFIMYEKWQDRASWQAHVETPHFAAFKTAIDGALAQFTSSRMTRIS